MLTLLLAATAMLPDNWILTSVVADTETLGLRLNSWAVDASPAQIEAFKQRPSLRCTPLPTEKTASWHCLSENNLYSLLQHDDGYLWVESERIAAQQVPTPHGLNGEVLSHYRNAFETVVIVRSNQHLFASYSGFQRTQRQRGATLIMDERDTDTFVQQWQRGAAKWTLTGQREAAGGVTLVYTQGTTQ